MITVSGCDNLADPDPYSSDAKFASSMEFAASMKIGWNLGNQMDAHNNGNPSETAWRGANAPLASQALMNGVAAQGFGVVRIPVTWLNKIGDAPNYTIDPVWLNRAAEVVGYAHAAGMKAIINLHHDGADSRYWLSVKEADLTGPAKTAMDAKYKAVWRQIANKFKDTGNLLIFEGFNELHDGSWSDGSPDQRRRVNELNQIFVNTVRSVGGKNSNRYLLIHGWVTRPSLLQHLVMPADKAKDRLIVGFHFYDPYNFTLEAAQNVWGSKANPGGGNNWGNESGIQNTFNSVKTRFIDNGIPVIIGEYGAVNRSGDAFAYQKYYMEYVTKLAHDCGFVPVLWDNDAGGTGRERSRMFNRATGQPANSDTAEIIRLMMKAVNNDYQLSEITPP